MQYVNVGIHDMVDDASDARPITVQTGTAKGVGQYDLVRIGNHVDIFIRRSQLIVLWEAIGNYIEMHSCPKCDAPRPDQTLCEECRTEQAIEDREEVGSERCPPRE